MIADFNSDGIPDVAVGGYDYYGSILLGKGDGTFGAPASVPLNGASWIAVGDFNGDNKADLAAVWPDNATAAVLRGIQLLDDQPLAEKGRKLYWRQEQ